MRAIVCTAYGPPDVLALRDMPKPVPRDDEVLVRIRATTVGAADCELRRFDFAPWIWLPIRLAFGIRRPRQPVLGQELAGDVEAVGSGVMTLKAGDRVFAATGIGLGAHAGYLCLREHPKTGAITTMPANIGFEEAAAVPYGGGEALQFLRKANVLRGQRVLVNGAGGSFGTFAVQLAKALGAHWGQASTPRRSSRRPPRPSSSSRSRPPPWHRSSGCSSPAASPSRWYVSRRPPRPSPRAT